MNVPMNVIVFWGFSYHFYVYDLFGVFFLSIEPLLSLRFIMVSTVSALVLIANSNKNIARVLVFNASFNNISAISWQSVLLVEKTGVPGEKQTCFKSPTNFIT